jgi:hypothetical protein
MPTFSRSPQQCGDHSAEPHEQTGHITPDVAPPHACAPRTARSGAPEWRHSGFASPLMRGDKGNRWSVQKPPHQKDCHDHSRLVKTVVMDYAVNNSCDPTTICLAKVPQDSSNHAALRTCDPLPRDLSYGFHRASPTGPKSLSIRSLPERIPGFPGCPIRDRTPNSLRHRTGHVGPTQLGQAAALVRTATPLLRKLSTVRRLRKWSGITSRTYSGETGGVISAAASRLGIPRATLNAMMNKLGVSRNDL